MCVAVAAVATKIICVCVCVCVCVASCAAVVAETSMACGISSCSNGSSFCSTTMPHKFHRCSLCPDCPWPTSCTFALHMSTECHRSKPAILCQAAPDTSTLETGTYSNKFLSNSTSRLSHSSRVKQELKLQYGANKGKAYTEEEDRFILCQAHQLGYGSWDELKAAIRDHWRFRFDWFFKSRTPQVCRSNHGCA